jgi:hypothetical protein
MRVLVWATHLQTDILAVAAYLDRSPDVDLLIVTPGAEVFLREPYARLKPFSAPVLDRDDPATHDRVMAFRADIAVADNHVPPRGYAQRLFYMWHGLGWKARSRLDLHVFYHQVQQLTGVDPRTPNSSFLAQCYGPTDQEWRVSNWGLPHSACAPVGMAFSDLLLQPPYSKQDIASEFRIDVMRRKTVALAITWHYAGIFARQPKFGRLAGSISSWHAYQNDLRFLRRTIELVQKRGANLLICLHDRHRYDPRFLEMVYSVAGESDMVEIRFKSEHPDNLADLLVADVMISNLSSFISYFYVLGRPAIHILPAQGDVVERATMLFSRFRMNMRVRNGSAWMLDPRDVGGSTAANSEEALQQLKAVLHEPTSGEKATAWLRRHVPLVDGKAAERAHHFLRQMAGGKDHHELSQFSSG